MRTLECQAVDDLMHVCTHAWHWQVLGVEDLSCTELALHANTSVSSGDAIVSAAVPTCEAIVATNPPKDDDGGMKWWHWLLIILGILLLIGCCAGGGFMLMKKKTESKPPLTNGLSRTPTTSNTNGSSTTKQTDPPAYGGKPGDYEFSPLRADGDSLEATPQKPALDASINDIDPQISPDAHLQNEATFDEAMAGGDPFNNHNPQVHPPSAAVDMSCISLCMVVRSVYSQLGACLSQLG